MSDSAPPEAQPALPEPADTILIVEDEPALAESVAYALRRAGFRAEVACNLRSAHDHLDSAALVLLDLMLPDGSGISLLQALRHTGRTLPVIVVSSRDAEEDRITALELGADDYVTKPFSPREVLARVRAVLRRVRGGLGGVGLSLNSEQRRAHYGEQLLALTRVEFDLIVELSSAPGKVFARPELIARIWGENFAITDRTIDSHIKSLRRKLVEAGGSADAIETVRGVGYRLNVGI